ncbi:Saccharopine dehydrogenase-like oxidoreductase [Araneus ventricosus]|uniref:Saccharopine dehydrogenase-like oxidoreductase n=1 Tax=Araneus ventricosus TaxID=182803 RepID=A0A4Y2J1E1_ARAVE|nr:Saccharopine dehydrogenase-like oxidoreductase [Araneus ventricosus]
MQDALHRYQRRDQGGLNSVEYFVEFGEGPEGKPLGCGTFSSLVLSSWDYFIPYKFEKEVEEKVFRKLPTKSKLPKNKYYDFRDMSMTYSNKESAWCIKCFGPDERAVKRSQKIRASYLNSEEHIEFQGQIKLPSLYEALRYIFVVLLNTIMCLPSAGRTLLQKYPSLFSAGLFSKRGPSRQQIMESFTKLTFYADGWKKKAADSEKQLTKPDKKLKLTVTGPEIAYALTTICMVQAALTVLQDSDRMPFKGGVYTPGVAFENTRLQERLEERGMTFTYEEIL